MMQFTMKSIENGWDSFKPSLSVYLEEPMLSEAKEDELLREIYMAALSLELYCIPFAFEPETAALISKEMAAIMASEAFASHQLAEPIHQIYIPLFQQVSASLPDEHALALVEAAATILYERLNLPRKPAHAETSLLWAKLVPYLIQAVGKWPIILSKFTIQSS
ncbi:hypothetical protein [Paenibacillus hexagrammi]|uniref:Uncharacterized protein n=1 Tax=Paenibacillus hexagrammi TaxID=2908839 RepID=A0ABY3SPV7_9BACL|nr:hypothetical protein [Paenibacillus sp. YPD9-1]UJF35289.1 hypothetical protein L0M14_09375 [Paenibacillus sp. YPD9-1]